MNFSSLSGIVDGSLKKTIKIYGAIFFGLFRIPSNRCECQIYSIGLLLWCLNVLTQVFVSCKYMIL